MAKAKNAKQDTARTNAMRILDAAGAKYVAHTVPLPVASGRGTGPELVPVSAREVAALVGKRPEEIFKTLVTIGTGYGGSTGRGEEHYVFVVPGSGELDLRKAAKAVGAKSIEMVKSRELLPLTGYIHGGCSPIGMKKPFKTVIDASAEALPVIFVSAGKIGVQIEIALSELRRVIDFTLADVTTAEIPGGVSV